MADLDLELLRQELPIRVAVTCAGAGPWVHLTLAEREVAIGALERAARLERMAPHVIASVLETGYGFDPAAAARCADNLWAGVRATVDAVSREAPNATG